MHNQESKSTCWANSIAAMQKSEVHWMTWKCVALDVFDWNLANLDRFFSVSDRKKGWKSWKIRKRNAKENAKEYVKRRESVAMRWPNRIGTVAKSDPNEAEVAVKTVSDRNTRAVEVDLEADANVQNEAEVMNGMDASCFVCCLRIVNQVFVDIQESIVVVSTSRKVPIVRTKTEGHVTIVSNVTTMAQSCSTQVSTKTTTTTVWTIHHATRPTKGTFSTKS